MSNGNAQTREVALSENALVESQQSAQIVPIGGGSFDFWMNPTKFDHVQRIAKIFASSEMVPAHYRNKVADCIIAVQMSFRLNVDPFMFMQNTHVVNGRPGMEAKLAIALINERGSFTGPIQWRMSGEPFKDDWTCTAYATHRVTGEVCESEVDWKMVKDEGWLAKNGSKWKTMPKVMFKYRTASFLARLYCPEVLMGMSTSDELHDIQIVDVQQIPSDNPPKAQPDAFAQRPGQTEGDDPDTVDAEVDHPKQDGPAPAPDDAFDKRPGESDGEQKPKANAKGGKASVSKDAQAGDEEGAFI